MDVRVWGVVEDRLIELRVEPDGGDGGPRVVGLPEDRQRTAVDRVRAALVNAGVVRELPTVTVRLEPPVPGGATWDLDLPLAIALLAGNRRFEAGIRWILATGRLGLDGAIHSRDLEESGSIVTAITALGGGRS